jgi:hypothetical protein
MNTTTRTIIGRWESEGGRYWVELYREPGGYTYDGKGCGGSLGNEITAEVDAVKWIEDRTASCTESRTGGYFHPGKRPMRRTI